MIDDFRKLIDGTPEVDYPDIAEGLKIATENFRDLLVQVEDNLSAPNTRPQTIALRAMREALFGMVKYCESCSEELAHSQKA